MNTKKSIKTPTSKKKATVKKIPPPPSADASCEEIDAYFAKYSWEDLEKAGHMRELTKNETDWMAKLSDVVGKRVAARQNRAQFNLALPADQLERFTRYANKKHIPPSTLARSWILERLDQELKEA